MFFKKSPKETPNELQKELKKIYERIGFISSMRDSTSIENISKEAIQDLIKFGYTITRTDKGYEISWKESKVGICADISGWASWKIPACKAYYRYKKHSVEPSQDHIKESSITLQNELSGIFKDIKHRIFNYPQMYTICERISKEAKKSLEDIGYLVIEYPHTNSTDITWMYYSPLNYLSDAWNHPDCLPARNARSKTPYTPTPKVSLSSETIEVLPKIFKAVKDQARANNSACVIYWRNLLKEAEDALKDIGYCVDHCYTDYYWNRCISISWSDTSIPTNTTKPIWNYPNILTASSARELSKPTPKDPSDDLDDDLKSLFLASSKSHQDQSLTVFRRLSLKTYKYLRENNFTISEEFLHKDNLYKTTISKKDPLKELSKEELDIVQTIKDCLRSNITYQEYSVSYTTINQLSKNVLDVLDKDNLQVSLDKIVLNNFGGNTYYYRISK